jgi:hypothetical protein
MLAKDETTSNFADRIHALFFLATPHRKADSEQLLDNMYRASTGSTSPQEEESRLRMRHDELRQVINDEFKNKYGGLQLWSFYETQETTMGTDKSSIVVDKDSATLGGRRSSPKHSLSVLTRAEFHGETIHQSSADHVNICRFNWPSDPGFKLLRDALAEAVAELLQGRKSTSTNGIIDWR